MNPQEGPLGALVTGGRGPLADAVDEPRPRAIIDGSPQAPGAVGRMGGGRRERGGGRGGMRVG